MWIDSEETLLSHLDDPAARENRAVDYKKTLDRRDPNGPRDVVETIAGMANADGGQVLIGIDEKGGVPEREIVGLGDAANVEARVEQAMSDMLALVEPRPRSWVLAAEGEQIVVVDVYPSVRLAALWHPGKRNQIMFPVRTGQGTDYMRPGDVEARSLSYGPRAQRIRIEQLQARCGSGLIDVFHTQHRGGVGVPAASSVRIWDKCKVRIAGLDEFGVRLSFEGFVTKTMTRTAELWIPYEWVTVHIRGPKLSLLLRASIESTPTGPAVTPIPA